MMGAPLDRLADRIKDDDYFLAKPLAVFAESEQLDDPSLARRLGCTVETLPKLRLCRRPHSDAGRFRHDLEVIAQKFNLDIATLANVLRRAEAISTMSGRPAPTTQLLMAARDRNKPRRKVDEISSDE